MPKGYVLCRDLVCVYILTLPLILIQWILLGVTKAVTANTPAWAGQANRSPRHFSQADAIP